MNPRHIILDREEDQSFWKYWNHGFECKKCRPALCRAGQDLRLAWKEALDVLVSYEDGKLRWITNR